MAPNRQKIILASQSKARREMLTRAGIVFEAIPAVLDEGAMMNEMQAQKIPAGKIALELAKSKALAIARKNPGVLVIGSDQVLEIEGLIMSKAGSDAEAREKLKELRGKTHRLISAVAVVKGAEVLWTYEDEASLAMRDFDDAFLDDYCAKAGEALTRSVGAYELEAAGAWLFSGVKGDFFTVLGMPLLPLLGYLREHHGERPQ